MHHTELLIIPANAEIAYLDSLSVVGFNNVEVETVYTSSWCQENAALLVKMSAHVH